MSHIAGTADDVRGLVPDALESWRYACDNVLQNGLVDTELKRICFRYLAEDPEAMDFDRFAGRELLALEWARAIAWDSSLADDALWERLHAEFSEPELVELGCAIGLVLGQQHWERTIGLPARAGLA